MAETEVLAIEVKQYVDAGGERQTIVPRLIGQTEAAKAAKGGTRATRQWDKASLLAEITRLHGEQAGNVAREVIDWADAQDGVRAVYGQGARSGSAQARLDDAGARLYAFNLWSYGAVELPFDFMRSSSMRSSSQAPFADSREARDDLRRRINEAVPDAKIPSEEERIRPSFGLAALNEESARRGFLNAMAWAFDQARRAQGP